MEICLDAYLPEINIPFERLQKGVHTFIGDQRKQLADFIRDGRSGGFECCGFNTQLWDSVIHAMYEFACSQVQTEPDIAIYAVGSYGREELCYHSDVDLVYTSSVDLEEVYDEKTLELIRLFYDFLDGVSDAIPSFRFSFIYRPLVDIDRWNYQDMMALIDMRFLAGDDSLTSIFKETVRSQKSDISIVLDLLKAKEDTFKKSNETIYRNQPDIKNGCGGLRTIQYALWMCGVPEFVSIPELYNRFDDKQLKSSLDFMLKIRNLLHAFADAPQEVMSYYPEQDDLMQLKIAQVLGYTSSDDAGIYDVMADYYSHAKYLHFKSESLIGDLLGKGIHLSETLGVRQEEIFCLNDSFETINGNELLQLFAYFQQYDFEIQPALSTFIFANVDNLDLDSLKPRMVELMASPGNVSKSLTQMHRLGLMVCLLPEFERAMLTRSERNTDPYTVGKHTLVAIEYLDEIRQSGTDQTFSTQQFFASEEEELNAIYQQISDANVLYMALLLHDIDKPASDHPKTGAEKARRIAKGFGFDDRQVDEISFLIREHLSMIGLARYHQWNEETIATFQRRVKSLDRLMKLYLLTYCDSKANGPQNFTELDKDNVKRLYNLIRSRFVGDEEEYWGAYAHPDEFRQFLSQMPVSYRITYSPQEIAMHIKLVKQVEKIKISADPTVTAPCREGQGPLPEGESTVSPTEIQFVDRAGYTELHLCSYNLVGEMHLVSGLFFAHNIDVREARAYTKEDTNIGLEIYHVLHQPPYLQGKAPMPLDDDLKKELIQEISDLMNHKITLEEIFAKHWTQLSRQWKVYEVEIDANATTQVAQTETPYSREAILPHRNYSEIVVKAEEQIGFLYLFSGILAKLGLNIEMCKCSAFGGRAIDRFYLKPISDPVSVRRQIMEQLEIW